MDPDARGDAKHHPLPFFIRTQALCTCRGGCDVVRLLVALGFLDLGAKATSWRRSVCFVVMSQRVMADTPGILRRRRDHRRPRPVVACGRCIGKGEVSRSRLMGQVTAKGVIGQGGPAAKGELNALVSCSVQTTNSKDLQVAR